MSLFRTPTALDVALDGIAADRAKTAVRNASGPRRTVRAAVAAGADARYRVTRARNAAADAAAADTTD